MKKKRILLTGDDGYNSLGTRLLIHYLKKDFDLSIAATHDQMTGVGGHGSFYSGGTWEEVSVDGVPALCVSGYPVDAIECAQGYFKKKFDLVISGINWGSNISGSILTSGTYAAAMRSLFLRIAPQAIAISWQTPSHGWYHQHKSDAILDEILEYPGKSAYNCILLALKEKLWGAPFLNINLPMQKATNIRFTRFYPDATKCFQYPLILDKKSHKFSYPFIELQDGAEGLDYDVVAVRKGFISITPCQMGPVDYAIFNNVKNTSYKL